MKKLNLTGTLSLVAALSFTACQKTDTTGCYLPEEHSTEQLIETPESFAEQIPSAFEAMEVLGGTEDAELNMENEGIPLFLDMEPFGIEEEELAGKGARPCALRDSLALRNEQKAKLRLAWKEYLKCRQGSMEKMRMHYRSLRMKYEKQRKEAVAAFRAQRITQQEFRSRMEKLRRAFHVELIKLNRNYHDVMRHCYKGYLMQVQRILSDAQFRVFIRCFRGHLPLRR